MLPDNKQFLKARSLVGKGGKNIYMSSLQGHNVSQRQWGDFRFFFCTHKRVILKDLFTLSVSLKHIDRYDVCSVDEGAPPATKSLMLESVKNTQAAPGCCSRRQTG